MFDYGVIDTLGDDPNRVGSPDEVKPKPPFCDMCGETLTVPFYDCDGYYVCQSCADKALHDTGKAEGYFKDWLWGVMQDWLQYTLPRLGDME